MRRALIIIPIFLLLLLSCSTFVQTAEPGLNLAALYNPSRSSLHPEFVIFHNDASSSTLFLRVYPAEFLFSQTNEDNELRAVLELDYKLYTVVPDSGYALTDTASLRYKLGAGDKTRKAWLASFPLTLKDGEKYLLQLIMKDMQRGTLGFKQLLIDKSSRMTAQNFKIISGYSGYPKFLNFMMPGEPFYLQYRDSSVDSVIVDYFRQSYELPRPPLNSLAEYHLRESPDTTFVFPLSDTTTYSIELTGRYQFRIDPEQRTGISVFNFGPNFPNIETPDDLLEPLFYLTTLTEYRDLRKQANRKLAVDDFWLSCGNSIDRSREMIRVYYSRAFYANLYFSSDREGWKTDRGMMLILFGPPDRVNIRGTDEVWYYISKRKGRIIEIVFQLDDTAANGADYIWKRSPDGWSSWNEAVRSWRNGKVFTLSD